MQVGCTLTAHNSSLTRFKINGSPLNPLAKLPSAKCNAVKTSVISTRKHLANLEKLLATQPEPPDPFPDPVEKTGFLENLNLGNIWPEMRSTEEISPHHLNRLRRLLAKSPERSPRNHLGRRWREFHGSNEWSGLLDPLDENLRREIIRYGEFVQSAYHSFHSDPATSSSDVAGLPRRVELPDRSYRVTKGIYATSSIGLPAWVDNVAPDLGWMTQRTSWMGYVAVCEDEREVARMGRRDIVIALRGTATCLEWAENMRDLLVQVPADDNDSAHGQSKVECGFLSLFKTAGTEVPSLSQTVVQEVKRLMALYEGETLSISVTGHSLGAALSLLVADELSTCASNVPPVAVFSFGGPRVGNRSFANRVSTKNVKVLRVVNSQDVITRVPGMFVSEGLDRTLRNSSVAAPVLNALDNNMPWAYAHVGTELRVDTKMSPFLKPDADVACCHDLEAYLHLVDGFLSSNCPFRSNAKRSLVKLLNEQKSNVKKLYTSKAKDLRLSVEREKFPVTSCLPSPS